MIDMELPGTAGHIFLAISRNLCYNENNIAEG